MAWLSLELKSHTDNKMQAPVVAISSCEDDAVLLGGVKKFEIIRVMLLFLNDFEFWFLCWMGCVNGNG